MRLVCCCVLAIYLVLLIGVSVLADCPSSCICSARKDCTTFSADIAVYKCEGGTKYCCPLVKSQISRQRQHPKKRLLPSERVCGVEPLILRIHLGDEPPLGSYPWLALLNYKKNPTSSKKEHLCGGTLISNRYVLTAAHCVTDLNGQLVSVLLGEHDINTDPDCTDSGDQCSDPVQEVEVESIIEHENYHNPYFKNDIALLRLKTKVNFTAYIRPICLPFALNLTEQRKTYTVAGWGRTDIDIVTGSSKLMAAETTGVPLLECEENHSLDFRPFDKTQMCAGGNGVLGDTCNGDSGGPLMDRGKDRRGLRRIYQVGIVSFGSSECGAMNTASVFTRVDAFLPWILDKLQP